jgi:hypothetical protein
VISARDLDETGGDMSGEVGPAARHRGCGGLICAVLLAARAPDGGEAG